MFYSDDNQNHLTTITASTIHSELKERPLSYSVERALRNYIAYQDENTNLKDIYEMMMCEMEKPMLDVIMQYTRGNQTKASQILGINRGTLRKKLKKYRMS